MGDDRHVLQVIPLRFASFTAVSFCRMTGWPQTLHGIEKLAFDLKMVDSVVIVENKNPSLIAGFWLNWQSR